MKQESLARWLKSIIIGLCICGVITFCFVLPILGQTIDRVYQGVFHNTYLFWLIFIWIAALPCYAVLALGWKIASNIGNDRSFSIQNAKLVKAISVLAAADTVFFFLGNIISLLLNMNHPFLVLGSFIIILIGVAISVAAAVLSHLILKAQILQEQSDWTI